MLLWGFSGGNPDPKVKEGLAEMKWGALKMLLLLLWLGGSARQGGGHCNGVPITAELLLGGTEMVSPAPPSLVWGDTNLVLVLLGVAHARELPCDGALGQGQQKGIFLFFLLLGSPS